MEKEKYIRPEIDIQEIKSEDVICTSGTGGGEADLGLNTKVETEGDWFVLE